MKTCIEMKYSIDQLIRSNKHPEFLLFWGHRPSSDGSIVASCLSQWWEAPFEENSVRYATAEHWMMAQKALLFRDTECFKRILTAKSPAEAKKLGRMVKGFDPQVWDVNKFQIVVKGNLLKFSQNYELKEFLLNTKNRVLVEASPVDAIWGIGLAADHEFAKVPAKWRGLNLLGFALMEVRDQLNSDSGS